MKYPFVLSGAAVLLVAAIGFFLMQGGTEEDAPSTSIPETIPVTVAPDVSQPKLTLPDISRESTTTATDAELQATPPDPLFVALFESPYASERVAAAEKLALRQDEASFRAIATMLLAAEFSGDAQNERLAQDLATALRRMHGPQLQAVATEMAYGPSPLLAEVAVDAAVAAEPWSSAAEIGTAEMGYSPQADAHAQQLLDGELHPSSEAIFKIK